MSYQTAPNKIQWTERNIQICQKAHVQKKNISKKKCSAANVICANGKTLHQFTCAKGACTQVCKNAYAWFVHVRKRGETYAYMLMYLHTYTRNTHIFVRSIALIHMQTYIGGECARDINVRNVLRIKYTILIG